MLGSPTRALNELVSEERERVIELLAALTASSDLVEQQRCQISDLKDALQAQVSAAHPASQVYDAVTSLLSCQSASSALLSMCAMDLC